MLVADITHYLSVLTGEDGAVFKNKQAESTDLEGKHPVRAGIFFSLRTTMAALLALGMANTLGINHPWWAAMTVWLVAQPTQGLLFERALARLAGSAVGGAVGVAILTGLDGQPLPSLFLLALWLMLCTGIGSLFRHFRNYAFVLAGYTAAIILLFGLGDGIHDAHLAVDRVICTMLGILCSAIASIYGVPWGRSKHLAEAVNKIMRCCLDRVEEYLHYGQSSSSAQTFFADLANLERSLDNDAAGSLYGHLNAIRIRKISGLLLELIALTPEEGRTRDVPALISLSSSEERVIALYRYCRFIIDSQSMDVRQDLSSLASVLKELSAILRQDTSGWWKLIVSDFTLCSALRSAVRPATALALATAFWHVSSWQDGPMMAITATLFASLFSAHVRGNEVLIHVLVGSSLGVFAGALVRIFMLPHAENFLAELACLAPFLVLGAWLMNRPATAKMAIDMNMSFLLIAQPGSLSVGVSEILSQSAAIIIGVVIALATYWFLFPSSPEVHRRRIILSIVGAANIASQTPDTAVMMQKHRLLRAALIRLLDLSEPTEKVFFLAKDCLYKSRILLTQHTHSHYLNPSNALSFTTAGDSLRHAGRKLSTCIASSTSTANRNI